ncbi:MAG: PLP-dependent transferase [Candidatus Uhrbacteria bacterium]
MHATLADLREDLADLQSIAESSGGQVWRHKARLDRTAEHYRPETHAFLSRQANDLWSEYQELATRIQTSLGETTAWTDADVPRLTDLKHAAADLLRSFQANLAFVLSAGDWQSPTFLHSLVPQAGAQVGRIVGTQNDYKRDGHLDADAYEKAFRKEYIDGMTLFPPEVCLTSSGMAAFATLVSFLQSEGVRGPILVGSASYFENKVVLRKAFPGQIVYVDESDADAVVAAAKRLQPQAVFLDTICNFATLALPDMATLVPRLLSTLSRKAYLVIDNAGMAATCQPLSWLPAIGIHARLFVVESLNKYYQLGFDRVTAGVVWTTGGLMPCGIRQTRINLGTNIPDASVLALPEPNRGLLERRLGRMGRNAQRLAETLEAYLAEHPKTAVKNIVYPGLPKHPSAKWSKSRRFNGSFLALAFKPGCQDVPTYKKFVDRAIEKARRDGVDLVSGTSFGFDVTRVYLTTIHYTSVTKPFVRISVGTETAAELDAVARVLISAIESV